MDKRDRLIDLLATLLDEGDTNDIHTIRLLTEIDDVLGHNWVNGEREDYVEALRKVLIG